MPSMVSRCSPWSDVSDTNHRASYGGEVCRCGVGTLCNGNSEVAGASLLYSGCKGWPHLAWFLNQRGSCLAFSTRLHDDDIGTTLEVQSPRSVGEDGGDAVNRMHTRYKLPRDARAPAVNT